jgi:NADH:ubiquinone oxidoreductase subunit E
MRHHEGVLKILAALQEEQKWLQEEQKRQAAEIASIAAAMNDLRENLHNEVRC